MCELPLTLKTGQVVPCGACSACMGRRINDWFTRLHYEAIESNFVAFCTLTYDDKNLPKGQNSVVLNFKDTQKYFKRVRKRFKGVKFKYFLCGEYGEKRHRPHYHFILFADKNVIVEHVLDEWGLGLTHWGNASIDTLYYVLKDMMKSQNFKKRYEVQPAIRCSQGLGDSYIHYQKTWHNGDQLERTKVYRSGSMVHMPRRYREKIFSKSIRELQNLKFQNEINFEEQTERDVRVYYQGVQQRLANAMKAKHKKEKL